MRVNANYRNLALPVSSLPLLDFHIPTAYVNNPLNQCLYDSPAPFLPLIQAPLNSLYAIAQSIQFGIPNSTTQCNIFGEVGSGAEDLTTRGKQTVGHRFMIGVTSLGEVQRYGLDAAALQTSATPAVQKGQFTTASGRTFVSPSDDSLRSTAAILAQDSTGIWPIPYSTIRTGTTASGAPYALTAYPGTLVVYADVPTQGLTAAVAQNCAALLTFAAGPGQTPGLDSGQLPPGYLPMTAANGLAAFVSATLADARAVATQSGASTTPVTSDNPSGDWEPCRIPVRAVARIREAPVLVRVSQAPAARYRERARGRPDRRRRCTWWPGTPRPRPCPRPWPG